MTEPKPDLITISEAAALEGVTPSAIAMRIERGKLEPVMKLPGRTGAYLLNRRQFGQPS